MAIVLAGCRTEVPEAEQEEAAQQPVSRTVSDVPLRILSTATPTFNEQLQLVWGAYSEQPIKITPAASDTIAEAAEQTDVVLFHNAEMGTLQKGDLLTPLPESFLESQAVAADFFLTGLVEGSMKWGDTPYALPLGSALPTVWAAADVDAPESLSWQDYHKLISSVGEGEAAEPLAEGWAAMSFLSRAASLTGAAWLFDRNTLRPVIEDPPYVRALEQLVADRQRYPEALLTPEQIWQRLGDGQLRAGIGWPAASGSSASPSATVRMLPYPVGEEIYIDDWQPPGQTPRAVALSPRGLVAGIASSCRQTAAAREFLAWLVSGEGHAALRASASSAGPIRAASIAEDSGGAALAAPADPAREAYDNYATTKLSEGYIRAALRLRGADEYLAALDRGVLAALSGEQTPEAALAAVADQWEAITERLGREQQVNQWRQAQGLRGR